MSEKLFSEDDLLDAVEEQYFRGWSGTLYFVYTAAVTGGLVALTWPYIEEFPAGPFIAIGLGSLVTTRRIYRLCRRSGAGRYQAFMIAIFAPKVYRFGRFIRAMFTLSKKKNSTG